MSDKVYIVSKGYGDLMDEMEDRGWVQNEDKYSSCYNLKWVVKGRDIKRKHI